MAALCFIQGLLEELNGVATLLDVREYLVGKTTHASIPGARMGLPEQLFVAEEADSVELALYIEPDILAQLEVDRPEQCLHNGNLESFCVALEGVSHFVKVVWSARMGRSISALELEIQAEVDKFIAAGELLKRQGMSRGAAGRALRKLLFEGYELRDGVPEDERERYVVASRAAKLFCEDLLEEYCSDPTPRRMTAAARTFYRSGLSAMVRLV